MVSRRAGADAGAALAEAASLLGSLGRSDVPIGAETTYRVGGKALLYAEIAAEEDLEQVVDAVASSGIEVLVLGKGSNLLISDSGFPGLCVVLGGEFATVDVITAEAVVEAGGGAPYPVLARQTSSAGLQGMEWAVGIPGSVGGAVAMNAGGHGSETSARLVSARVIGLAERTDQTVGVHELTFGYRHSSIRPSQIVCSATFFLDPGDPELAEAEIAEIVRWRRENQPGGRNAGSVFTNPPGDSAGRIIESAGLKGRRIGGAEVSDKHANFIQCDPEGSADDVYRLILEVQELVRARTGIELKPELRLVGFDR